MNYRTFAYVGLLAALVLTVLGMFIGRNDAIDAPTFGDVLRGYASDAKLQTIVALIIVDLVVGIIAALRAGLFDPTQLARVFASNVMPYIFGYLIYWCVIHFGMRAILSSVIADLLIALGYGIITTAIGASIVDNIRRMIVRIGTDTAAMRNDAPTDARG